MPGEIILKDQKCERLGLREERDEQLDVKKKLIGKLDLETFKYI